MIMFFYALFSTLLFSSTLIDCEVKAKLEVLNSKKKFDTKHFQLSSGPVVELAIIEAKNTRIQTLDEDCKSQLPKKSKVVVKLETKTAFKIKRGDHLNFSYQYSSPMPLPAEEGSDNTKPKVNITYKLLSKD